MTIALIAGIRKSRDVSNFAHSDTGITKHVPTGPVIGITCVSETAESPIRTSRINMIGMTFLVTMPANEPLG